MSGLPTPPQVENVMKSKTTLATRGLSYPLLLEDVLSKERARAWLF